MDVVTLVGQYVVLSVKSLRVRCSFCNLQYIVKVAVLTSYAVVMVTGASDCRSIPDVGCQTLSILLRLGLSDIRWLLIDALLRKFIRCLEIALGVTDGTRRPGWGA